MVRLLVIQDSIKRDLQSVVAGGKGVLCLGARETVCIQESCIDFHHTKGLDIPKTPSPRSTPVSTPPAASAETLAEQERGLDEAALAKGRPRQRIQQEREGLLFNGILSSKSLKQLRRWLDRHRIGRR